MRTLLEQILADRPRWMRSALCAEVDPDLMFPEKGDSAVTAKRLCMSCPVRLPCLEYALASGEDDGIYGGLSARERRRIRRQTQQRKQQQRAGEAA